MQDYLKKAVALGLGALAVTEEKVRETVEELVKKGEVSRKEASKVAQDLLKKLETGKKEVEKQVEAIVKVSLRKLDIPTRTELKRMESRLKKLESSVKKKAAGRPKSRARKAGK